MKKIKVDKKLLKKIAKSYLLDFIIIFGSKVTGRDRRESDIDVAVKFKEKFPSIQKRGKIYAELFTEISGCFPQQKVDLVFLEEVPLHFQFKIVTEGEIMYASSLNKALEFKERIINIYCDYKFFIDQYFEGIKERIIS